MSHYNQHFQLSDCSTSSEPRHWNDHPPVLLPAAQKITDKETYYGQPKQPHKQRDSIIRFLAESNRQLAEYRPPQGFPSRDDYRSEQDDPPDSMDSPEYSHDPGTPLPDDFNESYWQDSQYPETPPELSPEGSPGHNTHNDPPCLLDPHTWSHNPVYTILTPL